MEPLLFDPDEQGDVHSYHLVRTFSRDRHEFLLAAMVDRTSAAEVERVLYDTVGFATARAFQQFSDLCARRRAQSSPQNPHHLCRILVLPSPQGLSDARNVMSQFA